MDYILREKYLSQLIEVKNTPDIKVITGIRRSGKSVLTEEYAEYLKVNDASNGVNRSRWYRLRRFWKNEKCCESAKY